MTTHADKLNEAAARAQAATETRRKAEQTRERLAAEVERERARLAAQEREQEGAITRSVDDPDTVIPNVDRTSLDLAGRKAAAARKAYDAAIEAEQTAQTELAAAQKAFEIAAGFAARDKLSEDMQKLKTLIELLSLSRAQHVNEALFAAGFRISRNPDDMKLILTIEGPRGIPSPAETCARLLPKTAPAARKHYETLVAAEASQREVQREQRRRELESEEQQAVRRAEQQLESKLVGAPMALQLGFKAAHAAEVATIKASYMARRASV